MRERTRLEVEHARLGFLTPSHEFEVIGDTDSRYPVKDSFSIPFRFVCHLEIDYKKTRVKGGATGILISRRFVLTAAHNLETRDNLSARRVVVSPARNGDPNTIGQIEGEPGTTREFGVMEQSGLKEAGNILASAYLNALSDFMGMMLVPSVPSLVVDLSAAVLTSAYLNFGHARDFVFCVETAFRVENTTAPLVGHFLLLPDMPSLRAIFDAIRLLHNGGVKQHAEIVSWIHGMNAARVPFRELCDGLDLEPACLARHLLQKGVAEVPKRLRAHGVRRRRSPDARELVGPLRPFDSR